MSGKIAFQGLSGAYSDMACRAVHPDMETLPCASFEDMFQAVQDGAAELAMVPIENTVAGRVADIHHLLPNSDLNIIGEHFQRVNHRLLAVKGATLETLETVHSHVHALSQCRKMFRELGLKPVVHADTAGSAKEVAELGDMTRGAIASELAAEIYGLDMLAANVQDSPDNTTFFAMIAPAG